MLEHISFSLLNKLILKDLIVGLPKFRFKEEKVCDARGKGKHVKSFFKLKKVISTLHSFELLHIDLYDFMRV